MVGPHKAEEGPTYLEGEVPPGGERPDEMEG